jgi:hypothetical protein|tara:strand:+ start:66 stop:233 length:168 start_codon:yes stop_codon:yes gene_type:complete
MRELMKIHKSNQLEKRKEQIQETVKDNLQIKLNVNASKAADGEKFNTEMDEDEEI